MLPKGPYKPQETEKEILKMWLEGKFYSPKHKYNAERKENFCVVNPPPNANGNLHLGHMSGYAYQDLMGRLNRMKGKRTILFPGKDHAGIQTEVVFEKDVLEKQGTSKLKLGREEFYKQCYDFCMKNSENARNQEKNIGLSADFENELFTLDPRIVSQILQTFIDMYHDGLIYRGKRIINWCVRCKSALADIDTEYKESEGSFIYFKYGFLEPESDAVKIKNTFSDKEIEWKYERNTNDKNEILPFSLGNIDNFKLSNNELLKVFAIGYDDLNTGDVIKSKAIGILMRLDKNFRLIVVNPDFDGDLDASLKKIFMFEMKKQAGAHIIEFAKYDDDKFYNNGFVMGTVRPETKFGDTAIAVNDKDERYKDYIGKEFEVLTLNGSAKIKVIGDSAVDKEFGTGALKVTPAHAKEDWEIAERHPDIFPEKQVINFDGTLNHLAGKYKGMSTKDARKIIIEDMRINGMLVLLEEHYKNRIQICERCKYQIEPLVSHQWFLKTDSLKSKALDLVEKGETKILPEGMSEVYKNWMRTPENWCLTRQLWWGYRVPVWYKGESKEYISDSGEVKEMIGNKIMERDEDYKGLMYVGIDKPQKGNWQQDEDVLDTWFSSGQWPYVTLNTLEEGIENFYPTQVMETGWDILIFWVTRMMLLCPYKAKKEAEKKGIKLSDKDSIPFSSVYLHGLVLDKNGVKMSKSKGNGIDPFEMMQKYGTDALRLSFVVDNAPGQNYRLYEEKVASFRNFCNKIWNVSKFVLMNAEDIDFTLDIKPEDSALTKDDKDIINHINQLIGDTNRRLDKYLFGLAARELYDSLWHEFSDKYVEAVKTRLYTKDREGNPINQDEKAQGSRKAAQWVLLKMLKTYMELLHPFIPFITEKVWQELPKVKNEPETIMYSKWPEKI